MASDSIFLFELAVEELKSFIPVGNFRIRAKFGDVFMMKLKDPNELYAEVLLSQRGGKKGKRLRVRNGKPVPQSLPLPPGQAVLVASDKDSLITNMMKYPIEVTLFSKDDPYTLGIVEIPWPSIYLDYVKNIETNIDLPPALIRDRFKLFDEYTSKRVANIMLRVQLSKMQDNAAPAPNYPIESPLTEYSQGNLNPEFTKALTKGKGYEMKFPDYEEPGTIKTIYSGGKRKKKTGQSKKKLKQMYKKEKLESHSTADEINEIRELDEIAELNETTDNSLQNTNIEENNVISQSFEGSDSKDNNTCIHNLAEVENNDIGNPSLAQNSKLEDSIASLVRSQTHIETPSNKCLLAVTKHWSSTSLEIKERLDTLNYIFGNLDGPFGNKVYCVGYFTVQNDTGIDASSPPKSPTSAGSPTAGSVITSQQSSKSKDTPGAPDTTDASKSEDVLRGSGKYSFKICGSQCKMQDNNACFDNICSLDLPDEAAHLISIRKCTEVVDCVHKKPPSTESIFDDPIIMDFTNRRVQDCCVTQKVEKVTGGVTAKMQVGQDPCFCTCECTFGFVKKTTYCDICGGYELVGDEMVGNRGGMPFPCPIYHKLAEKGKKGFGQSSSGGDTKRKIGPLPPPPEMETPASRGKSKAGTTPASLDKKSNESDKESSKKVKKRKKDERFKFNYGYKGIPPQIGHSQCTTPCSGHLNPVPKHMGWLWNADNIPGLKHRPNWRPGAANKHVVRQLKIARYPEKVINKRRRKDTGKKKRPLKRPLLIVQKKDGEYIITMETMKTFTRPRTFNQYPYEDKPVLTYTVGRTEEENRERKKRKERYQRRVEREQRAFIQSAFQDMCKEICLKTYQQALGILPFAEDMACPCYPIEPNPDRVDLSQSCSCTESTLSSGSVTDDDEWIVEFTPPNAYFNPAFVQKKITKTDNTTQYTYLDYKVKLLDRYGNPVPRFFIGPDGKQQCSDLGGFWGPNKKWLEINIDGYIGPDGRWAPNTFIGPCGEHVDAEAGKFQATNGVWLVVGVDGYVNSQGKWCFYPKPRENSKDPKKQRNVEAWKKAGGCKGTGDGAKHDRYDHGVKQSEATWSCFGDASPRTLSQMGIVGHGHDRRLLLSTLERLMAEGEDITMPQTPKIPNAPMKKKGKKRRTDETMESRQHMHYSERGKCKHHPPSDKGIIAVDERGRKTYFTLRNFGHTRPKDRLLQLGEQGISLSSFHVPCFSSFISSEAARQQQVDHILQHNARVMKTAEAQT